ncbi:MAG TPA: transaldolase family protein [bacterium]|nr:transaldolase family protein [bacterium]
MENYLQWLSGKTTTAWWHDSADPDELRQGLEHGATGVTTNPVLAASALEEHPQKWRELLSGIPAGLPAGERAEYLLRNVTVNAARMFEPVHSLTKGETGYVCAQVNPSKAGDREIMHEQAKRFCKWAPNIAVKLPATAAGLDVLEECISQGITITATVSFTVAQVMEIGKRYVRGKNRAESAGIKPGLCFPVIMIGRIDDYLREVSRDNNASATESDIRQAGLAVTKRAYRLCMEKGYGLLLIIAALRGTYHMSDLAGGKLIMSIHPKIQRMILSEEMERLQDKIDTLVPEPVIERLLSLPEFVKAYQPDGLKTEEFISYGVTQRTLSQFISSGWGKLEAVKK